VDSRQFQVDPGGKQIPTGSRWIPGGSRWNLRINSKQKIVSKKHNIVLSTTSSILEKDPISPKQEMGDWDTQKQGWGVGKTLHGMEMQDRGLD